MLNALKPRISDYAEPLLWRWRVYTLIQRYSALAIVGILSLMATLALTGSVEVNGSAVVFSPLLISLFVSVCTLVLIGGLATFQRAGVVVKMEDKRKSDRAEAKAAKAQNEAVAE